MSATTPGKPQTTEAEAFQESMREAFSRVIVLARECKAIAYEDVDAAAKRLGSEGAKIMAEAGLTREEGLHYLNRISRMVFEQEPQA